jgi:hypothetical protein
MGERQMKAVAFGINVEAQKDTYWQATAGKANYLATLNTYAAREAHPGHRTAEVRGSGSNIEYDKAHDPLWGIGKATGIGVQWQDGQQVPFWPPGVGGMKPFRLPAGPTS